MVQKVPPKNIKDIELSPKSMTIGLLSLLGLVTIFFSFSSYIKYKERTTLNNEQVQTLLSNYEKNLEDLQKEVNSLRLESEGEVYEIKRKLAEEETVRKAIEQEKQFQEKISQEKINNLEARLSETSLSQDLTSIIKQWEPLIVYIACDSKLANSNTHYDTSGSGIMLKFEGEDVKVLTNRHVLQSPDSYNLRFCSIELPDGNSEYSVGIGDIEVSVSEYDWGTLSIKNPDVYTSKLTSTLPKFCEQRPSLGDEIVVLGFPGIGSTDSVTATDGIIAGFDGNYFITSAKVDQGNSGGAAILTKNNCLLGIPTFASLGQVESLARILDIWTVIVKK
ncbi:hypothetical protein A2442_03705 [Candidatus Campbellbacteria bacterium RIFOXYC2_FULL_35_25]|uniref:Serine protease n=1 Tax=Candidatus Campbellbacteria bacterium RIFOXYC2_FULL_35_25 TaxID=1797582 RepID=A0A1F5EJT5_9BACT|nr:MAG: hypothetical protein A2442_03705 [Candidatus Campbellbacteria bacterium RIFOXYC2_FULL_35_25]